MRDRRFGPTAAVTRRESIFNQGTNLLWETEHGPSGFDGPGGGDEVNIIERGKNYGWPIIHHQATQAGMESPVLEYTPACAPASGMFYRGSQLPAFKGNFFFGCLRGERIIRVVTNGRQVVSQENLLDHSMVGFAILPKDQTASSTFPARIVTGVERQLLMMIGF
jgi:glucose/arabinose dehydrogenase